MILRDLDSSYELSIAEIEARVHKSPWSKSSILIHLTSPVSISKGVFFESQLVGYLLGQYYDHELHVLNLAIDKKYQSLGFGYYLFSQAIFELYRKGAKACFLEARQSNLRALGLYRKLGFKTIAIRKKYYQDNLEDALVMTLEMGKQLEYNNEFLKSSHNFY